MIFRKCKLLIYIKIVLRNYLLYKIELNCSWHKKLTDIVHKLFYLQ